MSIRNGHVRWAFDLKNWSYTLNDLELATSCIQPEEKVRLAQYMFREDFNASLIGRLMMRRFVSMCMPHLSYNSFRFKRDGSHGRPYLAHHADDEGATYDRIDFNVSHHGRFAVLAASTAQHLNDTSLPSRLHQRIGVDVMSTRYDGGKKLDEFFRLMHRNFTHQEWRAINMGPTNKDKARIFMRHWALKESYVKNIGVGITLNLQDIDFYVNTRALQMDHVTRDTRVRIAGIMMESDWLFEESMLDAEHLVAVAIKNPTADYLNRRVDEYCFEMIDFDTVMQGARPLGEIDTKYCQEIMEKSYKLSSKER